MITEEMNQLPPDGKWGWMIVLAYGLNGICTISIIQGFGLIFKDLFPRFEFNATQGTIIINTSFSFGMILGLVNGPLLRNYGYRKMAIIGSLFFSIGVIITAFINSFTSFILFYGIFTSLGTYMTLSAFSYALNSYFTTKRGRAMSLAMTLIGLGPIVVPQMTSFLLSYYGFQGTILLYGAFSFHSLIGALLLHPLKWHMKDATKSKSSNEELMKEDKNKILDQKEIIIQEEVNIKNSIMDLNNVSRKRKITQVSNIDHDAEIGSIYGFDIPYARQISETLNVSIGEKEVDMYKIIENGEMGKDHSRIQYNNRRFKSIDTINLGSSIKIFEEKPLTKYNSKNEIDDYSNIINEENDILKLTKNNTNKTLNTENDNDEKLKNKSIMSRILRTIAEYFDLDLLKDPGILAPFIGEWFNQPPKIMYMMSLCLLIISRTSLLFINGFASLLIVASGLGAAKGIRSIYMSLVIPSYVPIHKLPNASGIQMIVNGMLLLCAGPMLGIMRDNFGNFAPSLIVINTVTLFTVIMWTIEIILIRRKKSQKQIEQEIS
ncbi:monocarboxylate transporter 9 isoform X2 [Apis mellifera]|uniref:Monocarboxylate transporter 9 isoform X2 n=1 Tax=Apis mellifera TaxID=7460 RepID=A0A7M7KY90_APIME|nr:monocarboxylate transporter 9 isoform X2 [Apis mellifera]|eukprot:XP_026294893.1 monocarboxylate transporter 9 isoform X2 [Apis mellifera]